MSDALFASPSPWRATYAPGSWVALAGPVTLVVLPPDRAEVAAELWPVIAQASRVSELAAALASREADELGDFAAFFLGRDGVRALLRGDIGVEVGDRRISAADAETWTEVPIGEGVATVSLEAETGAARLPLLVGVALVSVVDVDASGAVSFWSPAAEDAEQADEGQVHAEALDAEVHAEALDAAAAGGAGEAGAGIGGEREGSSLEGAAEGQEGSPSEGSAEDPAAEDERDGSSLEGSAEDPAAEGERVGPGGAEDLAAAEEDQVGAEDLAGTGAEDQAGVGAEDQVGAEDPAGSGAEDPAGSGAEDQAGAEDLAGSGEDGEQQVEGRPQPPRPADEPTGADRAGEGLGLSAGAIAAGAAAAAGLAAAGAGIAGARAEVAGAGAASEASDPFDVEFPTWEQTHAEAEKQQAATSFGGGFAGEPDADPKDPGDDGDTTSGAADSGAPSQPQADDGPEPAADREFDRPDQSTPTPAPEEPAAQQPEDDDTHENLMATDVDREPQRAIDPDEPTQPDLPAVDPGAPPRRNEDLDGSSTVFAPPAWAQQADAPEPAAGAPATEPPAAPPPPPPSWGQGQQPPAQPEAPQPAGWGQDQQSASQPEAPQGWGQQPPAPPEAPQSAGWDQEQQPPAQPEAPQGWGQQPPAPPGTVAGPDTGGQNPPPVWPPRHMQSLLVPPPNPASPQPEQPTSSDHDGATLFSTGIASTHKPGTPSQDDHLVLACLCPQGHANPPGTHQCARCGMAVDTKSPRLVNKPVLAAVVSTTGQRAELATVVLVGRAPSAQAGDGPAALMTVPSPSHDISRTHLRLAVQDWQIYATDLHSTNGTLLIERPGLQPVPLIAGVPTLVVPGQVIDLGDGVAISLERMS